MYPLNTNMVMEIAASKLSDRGNEWPDDPNRASRVKQVELPQDPIFMAMRSTRKSVVRWFADRLSRAPKAVEPTSTGAARVLPIGERAADCSSNRAKAA